jgi:multiple sugar transport system permease protein
MRDLRARRMVGYGAAIVLALAMVAPFLWMLSTALMDEFEVYQAPPPLLPAVPRFANFTEALTALPFATYFRNSLILAGCTVVGQVTTAAMAGYAFARHRFAGRTPLFAVYLGTLMIPGIALLVPRFLIVDALGLVDTVAGLVSVDLVAAWGIFLMRQYFLSLPRDMEDAARLDGASEWQVFTRVAIPLARPALATVALFAFIDAWKALLWPLIVARSPDLRVVEAGVASFHGMYYANWPWQMAAAVAALVPVLVVFLIAQKAFLRGLAFGGFK